MIPRRLLHALTDESETQSNHAGKIEDLNMIQGAQYTDRFGSQYETTNISGSPQVTMGHHIEIYNQAPNSSMRPNPTIRNQLVKSLLFDQVDFRVNNIKKGLLSTCQWLLVHPTFTAWNDHRRVDDHHGFIWIKGKPGCGKSTLMKTAFEWMRRQPSTVDRRKLVVPYFFNARSSRLLEKSSLGLYRTITHHVLSQHAPLRELFLGKFGLKNPGSGGENWTREELQDFLIDVVEAEYEIELCLFIDALDEAEYEDDARNMIQFLIQLCDRAAETNGVCKLQICLSSRHYPHITVDRGLALTVEKEPEHGDDIRMYIIRQLNGPSGPDKSDLQDRIFARSRRIFLWVVLVVDILNKLDDYGLPRSELRSRLEDIPAGLNDLFREALSKNQEDIETSMLLFQWILFARRPLEPEELYMAVEYSKSPADTAWALPSEITVPTPDHLRRYITNCSRGLVEVFQPTPCHPSVVQFVHETVREFLLGAQGLLSLLSEPGLNLIGISHDYLRVACLRAISKTTIPQSCQVQCEASSTLTHVQRAKLQPELRFVEYAVSYLFTHMEVAQTHEVSQILSLVEQVDERGCWKDSFRHWWNVLEPHQLDKIKKNTPLLFMVMRQRSFALVPLCFGIPHHLGQFGSEYDCVIHLATIQNRRDIVQMLLDKGVNADALGDFEEHGRVHVLYVAAYKGYEEISEMLLIKGANVNARGGYLGGALQAAACQGHTRIVLMLLEAGAAINAQHGHYGNALQAAAIDGRQRLVQILLHHGANINSQCGYYGTALQAASRSGNEDVVQMLLSNGADSNVQAGHFGNALQAAAYNGYEKIVQILLDSRANINAQGGYYGNALQAASLRGHQKVVQKLLDNEADVSATGGVWESALQAASAMNHKKIVQMLVEKGARTQVSQSLIVIS